MLQISISDIPSEVRWSCPILGTVCPSSDIPTTTPREGATFSTATGGWSSTTTLSLRDWRDIFNKTQPGKYTFSHNHRGFYFSEQTLENIPIALNQLDCRKLGAVSALNQNQINLSFDRSITLLSLLILNMNIWLLSTVWLTIDYCS